MRPVPPTLRAPVVAAFVVVGAAIGFLRQPAVGGEVRRPDGPVEATPEPRTGPATRATHFATPLMPPRLEGIDAPSAATLPQPASLASMVGALPPDSLPPEPREFFFTRGAYSGYRSYWGRRPSWAIDYPEADHHFITVLKRLTNLDAYDWDNAVRLDDPILRRYPFLYILEVGGMDLTLDEVQGLRDFLIAGGFLVVDDFWGEREWSNFEYHMARVLPGRRIVPLPLDHPLFSTFYDIEEVRQTPAIGRGVNGRPTTECAGCEATVFGIHDDDDRLMVVVNFNTDLGDAWEHADNPFYPLPYSTYAYQVGVNMVVYGMSR